MGRIKFIISFFQIDLIFLQLFNFAFKLIKLFIFSIFLFRQNFFFFLLFFIIFLLNLIQQRFLIIINFRGSYFWIFIWKSLDNFNLISFWIWFILGGWLLLFGVHISINLFYVFLPFFYFF